MITSPLSGTTEVKLTASIDTKPVIESWKHYFGIDITPEFHGIDSFQQWRCKRTNLEFFTPPEIAGSSALYAALQKLDWYYTPTKWEYGVALRDLQGCSNIFEIGSGTGGFLKLAKAAGLNAHGIEMNPDAVNQARSEGLQVDLASLEAAAHRYPEKFDAVCHFQVLEHVTSPKPFLDNAFKILRPGGKMICSVPNDKCFLFRRENLLDLPPHHMLRWNGEAFKALESYFPVRLVRLLREPLAPNLVDPYLKAQFQERCKPASGVEALFNFVTRKRIARWIERILLLAGMRRFVSGHGLYVIFEKR